MVQVVVAQRMWQRKGTAAEWQSKNPVLAAGEIGVQIGATANDTKFKIGNGVAPWNDIEFYEGEPMEMQTSATHIQWRYVGDTEWTNLVALADLKGPKGDNGTNGAKGDPGLSAYQVAVAEGFGGTRPEWLESLKGAKGDKGDAGPAGIPSMRRIQVLTETNSGSVVCDWSAYDEIRVTLTADTSFDFTGALDGQGCVLKIKQDAVGGHSVALGNEVRFNALISLYSATQTAGKADKVGFVYDGTDDRYDLVSVVPGI